MYEDIQNKFNENPTEINSHFTEYDKFMKEVEDHENDTFTVQKVPKSVLKRLRKKEKDENDFLNIGKEYKNLNSVLNHDKDDDEMYNKNKNNVNLLKNKRKSDDTLKNFIRSKKFTNNNNFKSNKLHI